MHAPLPNVRRSTRLASLFAALALAQGAALAQRSSFDPPIAPDLDPADGVVEVNLVAKEADWEYLPGQPARVYTYNGSIPGPTIEANVGDTVRVHFENRLPEPTTIHWHGIELSAAMDGSHISQRHVQPGETFEYEFELLSDGLYWYHPHVRTFDQVERGLYGVVLVRDPELEAQLGFDDVEEHVVVFDDILLDAAGQVVPAFSFTDPLVKVLYALNGREGNHMLVNGRVANGSLELPVKNGALQRWRVLNAANTTFCRLDMNTDAIVPMVQIGTDSGMLPRSIPRPKVIALDPPSPNRIGAPDPSERHTGGFGGAGAITPTVPPSGATVLGPTLGNGSASGGATSPSAPASAPVGPGAPGAPHSVPQNDLQGIFLVPGERMDVLFYPLADDGDRIRVFQHDWFRGRHSAEYDDDGEIVLGDLPQDGRMPAREYLALTVEGDPRPTPPAIPTNLKPMEVLDPADAVGVLPVHLGHSLPDPQGNVMLFAQAKFAPLPSGGTQMIPLPAPLVDSFEAHDVKVGETWIWEINNLSHGDHPFHTHGFFFQPYELEYVDMDVGVFNYKVDLTPIQFDKDTFRIPARLGMRGRSLAIVRALVRFDETGREGEVVAEGQSATFDRAGAWTSGGWLFHCHVLEHSGLGMLSFFELHDPTSPFQLLGKHLDGTRGKASLTGVGTLAAGQPLELDLVNALPTTRVALALGRTNQNLALAGGTIVPAIEVVLQGTSDASGTFRFRVPGWEALPSGSSFFAQAAFLDAGAPKGIALSNALSVRVP